MKHKLFLIIVFIIILSFTSCDNASITITTTQQPLTTTDEPETNQTTNTEDLTSEIQSTTEVPTSSDEITTKESTTIVQTTETPTTIEDTTEVPTTIEPTTEFPTTEVTTEEPITTEITTEVPTTIAPITISFDSNGGTSKTPITGYPGDTITLPSNPTLNGYIFDGWYTDPSLQTSFNLSIFPNENLILYAKWLEEITLIDEFAEVLINDFSFTCTSTSCVYQEYYTTYTFDLVNITFTKELIDNDTSGDNQTKNEKVVIDANWDVVYIIEIVYLETQTAEMRVTGNGLSGSYRVRSYDSNYLSESNMYDDALQFIEGPYGAGAVSFLEVVLQYAETTLEDLLNS